MQSEKGSGSGAATRGRIRRIIELLCGEAN